MMVTMVMVSMVMEIMVMVMVMMWLNAVSSFEAIGRWFLFQALESAAMMRGVAERGVGMWGEVFGGLVVRGGWGVISGYVWTHGEV